MADLSTRLRDAIDGAADAVTLEEVLDAEPGLRPTTTGIYGLAPWFRAVDAWRFVKANGLGVPTRVQYAREVGEA